MNPSYPSEGGGDRELDPEAAPSVRPPTGRDDHLGSVTVEVDGETFALRPDEFGGTHYDWLSGPNAGYGFTMSPTPNLSLEEHRESIRSFLAMIDPTTGFIEDD